MHSFDWEIEGGRGWGVKNLVKLDLQVKFWYRIFLIGILKRFLSFSVSFQCEWKVG